MPPRLQLEAAAREHIDALLIAAGWVVQDYRAVDLSAGRDILEDLVMGSGARQRRRPPHRRASVCARQFNHKRAVAEGDNVGYEVYRIRTRVSE